LNSLALLCGINEIKDELLEYFMSGSEIMEILHTLLEDIYHEIDALQLLIKIQL
jgi:hypothetical protein